MAFCSQCGSPLEGKFCAACGAPLAAGEVESLPPATGLTPTLASTLSYLPIFVPAVLFLVWGPLSNNKTVRFHALQSLFLQLAWVVLSIALGVVFARVSFGIGAALMRLLNLAFLILVGYLMWQTYQDRKVVLPLIGAYAGRQA